MNYKQIDFESKYFDLFELSEGIYAALSINDSEARVSAGIFDLGNYLIVFDTLFYPGATQDLYKFIKKKFDTEPSLIVNSHYHGDHVFGNYIFPENIPIMSTRPTLKKVKEVCFEQLNHFRNTADEELQKRKEMLKSDNPPFGETEIYNDIEFYNHIKNPDFTIRLPNFLIKDKIIINGTKRTLHLIPYGIGHTESDIIAYFPNEKICFMGDLLFANLDDSWAPNETGRFNAVDPLKLFEILKKIIEMDIITYVAGHGGLSTKDAVQMNMNFIKKYFINNP
jgi:glyoxylase-like metal-dependent hydrolase (beta-lactamase superfamily II)